VTLRNFLFPLLKVLCALVDRDFPRAENILAEDPNPVFLGGDRRLFSRDYVLGWIKESEGDYAAAKAAFLKARPIQVSYVEKWPDEPNPLMLLALTDAALGRKEEALSEGRRALAMRPISQDAMDALLLATDLAQVYIYAGEIDLAIQQLETLEQVPGGLQYGDLAKLPDLDPLRGNPRFQALLSRLKPIPIVNRLTTPN
jgi:tetratricopeptide (TPR) repeat protein